MITFEDVEDYLDYVSVRRDGAPVGSLMPCVDGWMYDSELTASDLRAIADKLDELNGQEG